MDDELICEECEQEVDWVVPSGRLQGVCANCEQELERENAAFMKDHIYVFGED